MKSCKFLSFLLVLTIIFSTFSVPVFASENDIDSNEDTIFADNASSNEEDKIDEEAIRDFVTRLYSICLNREPDSIGLDGWTQSLVDKKATGCSVAYGFVFSPEFQSLQVTNSEYVKYMYDAFFGRSPDVEGFNYWVDLLDKGMTREEIYCGFANSLEFSNLCKSFGVVRGYHVLGNDFNKNALVNLFVERLYNVVLNRTCDDEGMAGWTTYLVDHSKSGYEVAYGFVFSPEFINRNLCNNHFVEVMYEAFLGRSSDATGKAYWVDFLDNGSTRKEIFNGFAGSIEFAAICDSYGIEAGNIDTAPVTDISASGPCTMCEEEQNSLENPVSTPTNNPTSSPSGNGGSITIITTPSVSFGDGNQTSGQTQNPGQPTNPGQSANQTTNQSTSQPSNPTPGQSTNPSQSTTPGQSSNPSQTPVPGTTTTPVSTITPTSNPTPASDFAISPKEIVLNTGDEITISTELQEGKTILWASSNPVIARVDVNGKVTALRKGTTTITASSIDGKSATCDITVVEEVKDALFEVPYIATYYFNPKPEAGKNIQIPLYFTDADQSEYLRNDTSITLDLIYTIDGGKENVIKNLPLGDYTLNLGSLSEGMHYFSVQVLDNRTGLKSHKLYNDLWVLDYSKYEIKASETYYMTAADLTKYGIHNDDSNKPADMISTRDGLTKLFSDKQAEGKRKIVLLPGTYRVDCSDGRDTCISIPSYFTVDMNGSTFKLNPILNNDTSGCIVKMDGVFDAHLTNGVLVGDRFERKEIGLEYYGSGEGTNTVYFRGSRFCSIDDLIIKDTTGHTVFSSYILGPVKVISSYTNVAIIDGEEVANSNCSTSPYIDLQDIINWDKDSDYVYVGHPGGYRGIMGDAAVIYVSFYDANKNFMETVTGYQYRKLAIPSGARYVRATMLGSNIATSGAGALYVYSTQLGEYYEVTNIDFYDTRTTCIAPAACNNLLIENCTYTRCGVNTTKLEVDFEDCWEEGQDIYYRFNSVLEKAVGNDGTIVDNAGYNHIYENLTNHSITIRGRALGVVVRNINDSNSIITWAMGDKVHNGLGRIYDNNFGSVIFYDSADKNSLIEFKVKHCTITCPNQVNLLIKSNPDRVVYEDCTFLSFGGFDATLVDCTVVPAYAVRDNLYFYNCTFGNGNGSDFNLGKIDDSVRVFENCIFTGKTSLTNGAFTAGLFRNCEFEDLSMLNSINTVNDSFIFDNCKINSISDNFIYVGPFDYSVGHINIMMRNTEITHSGNRFIYLYGTPTGDSEILFENCTITTTASMFVDYAHNGYSDVTKNLNMALNIILRDITISQGLQISETVNPAYVKIIIE